MSGVNSGQVGDPITIGSSPDQEPVASPALAPSNTSDRVVSGRVSKNQVADSIYRPPRNIGHQALQSATLDQILDHPSANVVQRAPSGPRGCQRRPRARTPGPGRIQSRDRGRGRRRSRDAAPSPELSGSRLPVQIENATLSRVQQLLEESMFYFAQRWVPRVLEIEGWEAPEAGELTEWSKALSKVMVPRGALQASMSQYNLHSLLDQVREIRHNAVHRLTTGTRELRKRLPYAIKLAQCLRDDSCVLSLETIHNVLKLEFDATVVELGKILKIKKRGRSRSFILDENSRDVDPQNVDQAENLESLRIRSRSRAGEGRQPRRGPRKSRRPSIEPAPEEPNAPASMDAAPVPSQRPAAAKYKTTAEVIDLTGDDEDNGKREVVDLTGDDEEEPIKKNTKGEPQMGDELSGKNIKNEPQMGGGKAASIFSPMADFLNWRVKDEINSDDDE